MAIPRREAQVFRSCWPVVYLLDTAALLAVPKEPERQIRQPCLLAERVQEHRVTAAGQQTVHDAECRKEVGRTF